MPSKKPVFAWAGRAALLAACSVGSISLAHAQSQEEPSDQDESVLEPATPLTEADIDETEGRILPVADAADLESITVYATRSPIPAFEYPGQVTVLDRDVIDDFNPSRLSEIFDAIPGAGFQGGPRRSGEVPNIRGIGGEGVLVLFDGARQSFVSGHDGRFFIDPDLIQAVEVVRGPTSALYGSGALGGVIAIRTITADDLLEEDQSHFLRVTAGYQGVNEEYRISGTGAWRGFDGRVDLVGNVTYRDSGDIELGNGFALPADDEIVSSLLKGTFQLADDLSLTTAWIRYGGDSVDPNNPQGVNVGGAGNENVFRDIESNTLQATLEYQPAWTNLVDLKVVGYRTTNDVEEDEVLTDRVITREVETVGMAIDNRSSFELGRLGELRLTYGGEYYQDEQIGRDNTTADGTRGGVPDAETRFYGLFVQAEWTAEAPFLPGEFTVIPGVRWDRFESEAVGEQDVDDEAISPKVGVSYRPIPEVLLFGNWSEAFRAPSFNQLYADGVHFQIPNLAAFPPELVTNFFISNPDLESEESQTWEIGAGLDLDGIFFADDRFTAKGAYFQSDVDNLIDLEVNIPAGCFGAPFPPCGSGTPFGNVSRNVNVTNAEIDGFELEAQYDAPLFYLRSAYSTLDGEDVDTGEFLGLIQPNILFLDGGLKLPYDLRLGGRVTIASDFDEVNDPTLERDGYAVGDIYAVWEPLEGPFSGVRVDLGVDNVTDADYEVVAAGVSQPGRNYKATVRWQMSF